MKLLISPRLRQNSPLEVQTISSPMIGFDTARKSRLATEKPTEACSMYQVIPWHKKVSGWDRRRLLSRQSR
jgi:hypothetical protein